MPSRTELRNPGRSAALILAVALSIALPACTSSVDPGSVSESGDELKGGVPANGKTKSNKGKHNGQAGSLSMDEDAGVPEADKDKDRDKGKDKDKDKDKESKGKSPKDASKDRDASIDEDTDEDTDEGANDDVDEDEDADEQADETQAT